MMNNPKEKFLTRLFLILLTMFVSACNQHKTSQHTWVLNKEFSSISITTIKNNSLSEISYFTDFKGSINSAGYFDLNIELNSLETNIPIRNERIQEHLFESKMFPTADIHTQLKPADLENGVHTITFDVDFHGLSNMMTGEFLVFEQNGNKVITLHKPLIVDASSFALEKGISTLKNIAKLQSIANSVPLHIILSFQKK